VYETGPVPVFLSDRASFASRLFFDLCWIGRVRLGGDWTADAHPRARRRSSNGIFCLWRSQFSDRARIDGIATAKCREYLAGGFDHRGIPAFLFRVDVCGSMASLRHSRGSRQASGLIYDASILSSEGASVLDRLPNCFAGDQGDGRPNMTAGGQRPFRPSFSAVVGAVAITRWGRDGRVGHGGRGT
jgi:hypothetical protein